MASKLRQQILDAQDIKKELVTVEEWGVTVEVRGLTGAQLIEVTKAAEVSERDDKGKVVKRTDDMALARGLILNSTYDPETGELVFDPLTDGGVLYGKSLASIKTLAAATQRLSGLSQDESDATEKN